jgi:archaellum component FlaC
VLCKKQQMSSDKKIIQELRKEIIELKLIIVQLLAEIKDLKPFVSIKKRYLILMY